MFTRDAIALVAQLATPLLLAGLGFLFAWAQRKLAAATQDQRLLGALDLLSHGAQGVVADLSQHAVQDLKDPNKPGTWDKVTQAAVKETAIRRLQEMYPRAVSELQKANPEKTAEVLGSLVEAAVLKYKKP